MVKARDGEKSTQGTIDGQQANADENRQTIEQLRERYTLLNTKKIQAEAHLETAEKELARLQEKARNDYGTDDVTELKKQLEAMEAENERQRSEYQRNLQKIEADLTQAEQKYTDVKDGKDK